MSSTWPSCGFIPLSCFPLHPTPSSHFLSSGAVCPSSVLSYPTLTSRLQTALKAVPLIHGLSINKEQQPEITDSSAHWGSCYLLPHVQAGGEEPGAKGHAPAPGQEREGCQSTARPEDTSSCFIWPLLPRQRGFLGQRHLTEVTIRLRARTRQKGEIRRRNSPGLGVRFSGFS